MDGRALTAKELAFAAHVSPPTASGHLARLTDASLLAAEKQGRHRYFRLASPLVGQMVESIMAVAGPEPRPPPPGAAAKPCVPPAPATITSPAGSASPSPTRSPSRPPGIVPDGGELTESGHTLLGDFGASPPPGKRIFCRPCLDWSERRPHLAGRLGAALAARCLELNWIERQRDSRAVTITAAGRQGFSETFNIHV